MPSARAKAQMPGIEFFAQMSAFVCRQPTVLVSESFTRSGAWNLFSFVAIVPLFCRQQCQVPT